MERTRKTVELPETWQERKLREKEQRSAQRQELWLHRLFHWLPVAIILLLIFIAGVQCGMQEERNRHQPKVEQEP